MYNMIADLKEKGICNMTKEELEDIKEQALREHEQNLQTNEKYDVEFKTKLDIREALSKFWLILS